MKRAPLLVLAFFAVLVAAVILLWRAGGDRSEPAGPAADPAARGPSAEAPGSLEGGAGALATDSLEPSSARVAHEGAGAWVEEDWDRTASRLVVGEAVGESACREADELTAYALESERSVDRLLEALAREHAGDRIADTDEDAPDPVRVLARRALDAEGSFELPFPPDADVGHVLVVGRRSFLDISRRVTLGDEAAEIVCSPRCGALVRGRLVPPAGAEPEALVEIAAEVRLRLSRVGRAPWMTDRSGRRTWADEDGTFELPAVELRSGYEVVVDHPGFAPQRVALGELAAGEERDVTLELLLGGVAAGRVLDGAGEPIAGARVEARPQGDLLDVDWAVRETKTDEAGEFELGSLSPGRVALRAFAERHLESTGVTIDVADRGRTAGLELVLEDGGAIAGVVRWPDGSPLANGRVRARFDTGQAFGLAGLSAMRGARGEDETDEEGRFRVTGLGAGPFRLAVAAEPPADLAGGDDEEWTARSESLAPGAEGVELVLAAPSGVEGLVRDPDGAPLAEFHVTAVRMIETPMGPIGTDTLERDFQDETGRFRFTGLEPGDWTLHARSEGRAPSSPARLAIPPPEDAEALVFVLERAATVSGTVLSADGTPVAGALVTTQAEGPDWVRALGRGPRAPEARSDAEGLFHLDALAAGEVSLVARAEGFASSDPVTVALGAGEDEAGVELVLHTGGTLTGEVYDGDGEPAAHSLLQLISAPDFRMRFERADSEGLFRVEHLDPGQWQVVSLPSMSDFSALADVDAEDTGKIMSEMRRGSADIVDGEESHVVLGAPPEDPVRVTGRVTMGGEPYGNAFLSFYRCGAKPVEKLRTAQVGADGSYSVVLDAPGTHLVTVQRVTGRPGEQEAWELVCEIPDRPEHELDVEVPAGRISGRLSAPDGAPGGGVRITLVTAEPGLSGLLFGGKYAETSAASDGTFDLQGIGEGDYMLSVGGMSVGGLFGSEARWARSRRQVHVDEDEWVRNVDFELEEPGVAVVTVRDELGEPVLGAAVFAREAESGQLLENFSFVTTGNGGRATYGGLGEGTYTFSARKGDRATLESPPVRLRTGEEAQVLLTIETGTILLLSLRDTDGNPLRASVRVVDQDGREYQGMLAMEDLMTLFGSEEFSMTEPRVGPVPSGRYRVVATAADGRSAKKPVTLSGQRERRLVLRMR